MAFERSKPRGSRYQQKIDAVTLHVAYEGAQDEAEYFTQLSQSIPKQFHSLLRLIPVKKSSTASAPSKVFDDLCTHLETHKVNLKTGQHIAFMVIDRDHHFSGNHQKETRPTVRACKQRNIQVLCSTPAFDLWILCHYIDVAGQDEAFKQKALANKKISTGNTFLKGEVSKVKAGETTKAMLKRTEVALTNEEKFRGNDTEEAMPPAQLQSNVGKIINVMIDHGVPIVKALSR
ncbi:MAG: RloB domain-containing protein [Algicola sp.]|nr:RloB domain-containing protein [Algicola sp.]